MMCCSISFLKVKGFHQALLHTRVRFTGRRELRPADDVLRPVQGELRNGSAFHQRDEFSRRSQVCACIQYRVQKKQHLGSENRMMTADEDQHLAWCDDVFLRALALLLWRLQTKHFIGRSM